MKLCFKVSAQELLDAGAPLNVIRQSYRDIDHFAEKIVTVEPISGVQDAKVVYTADKSARENTFYTIPAKTLENGFLVDATATGDSAKLVYGGSIKDSYVLVTKTVTETNSLFNTDNI